ncbi:MAG: cell division protein FtsL [Firmicutes bacterium HGW-Firmicutes-20]|jgi:cell division protein DivIC|nr:septum formation initiator family protein [Erysipelotrichaceae bacterium]PKM63810.1 MAG: cell division protein FtsL [Firmicutes bacterium HGW-Firmicutes-20]PKM89793.1 MAG: cell division protein FtsL [Firmicutes bacterium HGW-Firmicutes-10]
MKNEKKSRKKLRGFVLNIIAFIIFGVSLVLLYQVSLQIVETVNMTTRLINVQEQMSILESENDYLTEQKDKLNDPEYVKNYARFGYMLSKEGEQIFYLPEKQKDE